MTTHNAPVFLLHAVVFREALPFAPSPSMLLHNLEAVETQDNIHRQSATHQGMSQTDFSSSIAEPIHPPFPTVASCQLFLVLAVLA